MTLSEQSTQSEHNARIVKRCFDAYKAKDRAAIEQLLADTFTFTSPYDDAIGRAAYFERCWPGNERIRENIVERVFVEHNEAFVTYLATTVDGMTFRNTEFFRFNNGRIVSIDVYFGAAFKHGVFALQKP